MNRLSLILLGIFLCAGIFVLNSTVSYAGDEETSITINNVTIPPGLENIEYSGVGGSPYPAPCPFNGGGIAFLDDGDSLTCNMLPTPGTYAVIELNGPFTAELSCNLPVILQVPGVISFTRSMQDGDNLVCTITNTAIPLELGPIFPNIAGIQNIISFDEAGPNNPDVAIFWSFFPGEGTNNLTKPCNGAPLDIIAPNLLSIVNADFDGSGDFVFFLPLGANGLTVALQAMSLDHCITSEVFAQELGTGGDD